MRIARNINMLATSDLYVPWRFGYKEQRDRQKYGDNKYNAKWNEKSGFVSSFASSIIDYCSNKSALLNISKGERCRVLFTDIRRR